MSRPLTVLGALAFVVAPLCAAPAAERAIAGQLKSLDAWKTLGRQGCLRIRSQARWDAVQKLLVGFGWEKPTPDPLASLDFARDQVICLFRLGDEADKFSVHRLREEKGTFSFSAERPSAPQGSEKQNVPFSSLDAVMSYIIYKSHAATPPKWNFLLVALPHSPSVKITVGTYHPMNGGPYPTPDKAQLEWSATLTPDSGDVVDGLRGVIRAEKPAIAAGEDILVEFKLEFDNSAAVKPGHFALKLDSAWVWDGKYSNGYRNHAFLVETPDGQSLFLRRPVQDAWDKNAPHPVEVAAGKPYVLPEWYEGKTFKSLKALGLDTTKPGAYRITGIYMESAGDGQDFRTRETIRLWGGNLATAPLEVTVR